LVTVVLRMSELYLIRHGQASFGKDNYDVLSENGTRQSKILGAYLARLGLRFDAIYSGTLDRQRKTAEITAEEFRKAGLEIPALTEEPGFNEYNTRKIIETQLGTLFEVDPELKEHMPTFFTSRRSFQLIFERAMGRWVSGEHGVEGLETWPEFQERVARALKEIMARHGEKSRVAVFASGGSISASVQFATGLSGQETINLSWQMVNTAVTRLRYNRERVSLQSYNCYPHLELAGGGELITYR
jgi:broad specificity phosphatase PhoE